MSHEGNQDQGSQSGASSRILVPEPVGMLERPRRHFEGPIARFKNATATGLSDQVNGMILVLEDGTTRAESPRGSYVFDNCVKAQGSLTTQVNGLLVGIKQGAPRDTLPAHPGIHGLWNRCSTVESIPPQGDASSSLADDLSAELDINANHTIQLNGGIVTSIIDNRLIIPKLSQS